MDYHYKNTYWGDFISGEAQLECEDISDKEMLLDVCKQFGINFAYIDANEENPFWYIKDNDLITTIYYLDDYNICSAWTVKEYMQEKAV
jgi:hypothetical protein